MRKQLITLGLAGGLLLAGTGCGHPASPVAPQGIAMARQAIGQGTVTVNIRWPQVNRSRLQAQAIPNSTVLVRVSILDASGHQQASTNIPRPDSQAEPFASTTLLLSEGSGYQVKAAAYRDQSATTLLAQGNATGVQVWSNQDTSVAITLAPAFVPAITSLSPASGMAGELVTISGSNFGSSADTTFRVTFNGAPATTLTRNSDTEIVAVVPQGATTGRVVVTADGIASETNVAFDVLSSLAPESFFRYGVYTQTPPTFGSNVLTDGYDSSQGTYGDSNVLQNPFTGTSVSEPQPFPTIAPFTTGTTSQSGSGKLAPGAYDAISISGQRPATLHLTGGDYYVNNLSATGKGIIVIDGPTRLYIQSAMDLAGQAILNPSGIPANLQIFYDGTDPLTISGQAELYGVIFAPNADVTFSGSGKLFGAVAAKSVTATGNFTIHFDVALRDITG